MPRSVPARWLTETLHWTTSVRSPCCAISRVQNERAKKPRESCFSSSSMTNAPFRGVCENLMVLGVAGRARYSRLPEEGLVDLRRTQEVLELLQPREASELERLAGHVDPGKDVAKLARPAAGVPV